MKLWLLMGVTGVVVVVAGVLLIEQLAKQTETTNQTDIDKWVDQMVAESLVKKLNQPIESIMQVFHNSSTNSDLMNQIQATLHKVQLKFERQSSLSNVEVQLDISYKDGTYFSTNIEKDWDELPSLIRKQFLQTGKQVVHLDWQLPSINAVFA